MRWSDILSFSARVTEGYSVQRICDAGLRVIGTLDFDIGRDPAGGVSLYEFEERTITRAHVI